MGIILTAGDASKDCVGHPRAYNYVFVFHGTGMHGQRILRILYIYIFAMELQSDIFELCRLPLPE